MSPAEHVLSSGHTVAPVFPSNVQYPAPKAVPLRIRHLDSLRAVAACLVVWSHFAPMIGPALGA